MLIPPGTDSQQYVQALPSILMSHLFHSQDFVRENQKAHKIPNWHEQRRKGDAVQQLFQERHQGNQIKPLKSRFKIKQRRQFFLHQADELWNTSSEDVEAEILHGWKGRLDRLLEEKPTKAYEIYRNQIVSRKKSPNQKYLEHRKVQEEVSYMVVLLHHLLGILGIVEEQKSGGDGSVV